MDGKSDISNSPSPNSLLRNHSPNLPEASFNSQTTTHWETSMPNLKTDSPICRRIARSFLQFLNSVEPSVGVDGEALQVARECLAEVFKIDQASLDNHSNCDSLIDIFSSGERSECPNGNGRVSEARNLSLGTKAEVFEGTQSTDQDRTRDQFKTRENHSLGKDDLFGQFLGALEKIHYLRKMPNGNDDQMQLDRATTLFHEAVQEMEMAGCNAFDLKVLADTFKSQGNKAMQAKLYAASIEQYTIAIALCDNNAVYYCNRAAAYTHIRLYDEAVQDCLRSIEIDPNYSKAYSRLGFAYYSQGKYQDAIDKGFTKALQLNPNNDSVRENIWAAERKLIEEQQMGGAYQTSSFSSHGQSSELHIPLSSMLMHAGNTFSEQVLENGETVELISGNMSFNLHAGRFSPA